MGLFDKLKNMFTEEVEEEEKEPIKKEVFQVEIPAPKIEEKKERKEEKEEPKKEEIKREEKFVFPVYFDDSDFEEPEPPKRTQPTRPVVVEPKPKAPVVKKPEPKKVFKPSPVISPVYGVLDKNYKKEDIVSKKNVTREDYFNYKGGNGTLAVDDIRKKAFGTLEDELETTLSKVEINKYDEPIEQSVTKAEKEALEQEAIEQKVVEPKENIEDMFFSNDMTLEEAFSKYDMASESDELNVLSEKDDLIESDLFNLIDSMYDKNDNKEA